MPALDVRVLFKEKLLFGLLSLLESNDLKLITR